MLQIKLGLTFTFRRRSIDRFFTKDPSGTIRWWMVENFMLKDVTLRDTRNPLMICQRLKKTEEIRGEDKTKGPDTSESQET